MIMATHIAKRNPPIAAPTMIPIFEASWVFPGSIGALDVVGDGEVVVGGKVAEGDGVGEVVVGIGVGERDVEVGVGEGVGADVLEGGGVVDNGVGDSVVGEGVWGGKVQDGGNGTS